jgi:Transposase, Mutator family
MAPWCACGWIGKRRRSRCWPSLGCVPRARKCSWLSKHGRRQHRGLASARRSCRARPTAVGIPDRRRRAWARECDRGGLDGVPVQRCTVHKHRNLLAHAPERLHEEISADYNGMIYAATREEVDRRRKAFIRKWRLKHRAVASIGSSPSHGYRQASGAAFAPPMPSSGCMRSSSDESRRRPCCHRRIPRPCCFGRGSPPARSARARSMVGRRSRPSRLINRSIYRSLLAISKPYRKRN